jgi:uncharacterized membrane protein (DUF485 family)
MADDRLSDELVAAVRAHPAYAELTRARTRLATILTSIILIAFFGFTLLIAFDKAWLAQPIGAGVTSIGIPLGFGIIVLAIVLTAIYVNRANGSFDDLTRRIREDVGA